MGLLEDLGAALVTAGAGTLGTDLFLSLLPEDPDAAVALFEVAGGAPAYAMGDEAPAFARARVQVLARGAENDAAVVRARLDVVLGALEALGDTTTDGRYYLTVQGVSTPRLIARDTAERALFAAELDVWHQPSAGGPT